GDAAFQAPRRFFLQQRSGSQSTWAFLSKRLKSVADLGSFHSSDLLNVYSGDDMASYLVCFITNLDPNGSGTLAWPTWTTSSPNLLTFLDGQVTEQITQDTYRADAIAYMINDPTQGSPYDTGTANAFSVQFKRIASIQGDAAFQAPRRFFLQQRSGSQSTWAFLSKRLKSVPVLGSFHSSDLSNVYGGGDMASYLVRFVTNLDPNGSGTLAWPTWTTSSPNLLTFLDGQTTQQITQDTYRSDAITYMINMNLEYVR
ncbi:hypothetical protein AZE42_10478, partial [Rhizopogon vesiculosus]